MKDGIDQFRDAYERSIILYDTLMERMQTSRAILSATTRMRTQLGSETEGSLDDSSKAILNRLDNIEKLARSGPASEATSMLASLQNDFTALIEERNRIADNIRRRLQTLLTENKNIAVWIPDARQIGDRAEELEREIRESGQSATILRELSELEASQKRIWKSASRLELEVLESHGPLHQGIWGTVEIELTSLSDFPTRVIDIEFPPEIEVKDLERPIDLLKGSKKSCSAGIRGSEIGTFPASLRVHYQVPWDNDFRESVHRIVLSVEATEEQRRQSASSMSSPILSGSSVPRQCQKCSKSLKPQWRRCPYCGTSVTTQSPQTEFMKSLCPSCGKPVERTWKKCPYCARTLH